MGSSTKWLWISGPPRIDEDLAFLELPLPKDSGAFHNTQNTFRNTSRQGYIPSLKANEQFEDLLDLQLLLEKQVIALGKKGIYIDPPCILIVPF